MGEEKDWRINTDSFDYLKGQKKTLDLNDRRPVIRTASDLVGPGIGTHTTRITDFNDILATFNGYYSAQVGAASAPNTDEDFVGYVVSDAVLGGRQVFTGLTSGVEYSRTFTRSSTDPEMMGWTNWIGQRIPPTVTGYDRVATWAQPSVVTRMLPPTISTVGDSSVYERSDGGIRVRRQGVYTGHVQVGDYTGDAVGDVYLDIPNRGDIIPLGQIGVALAPTVNIPFTAIATDAGQGIAVTFILSSSFTTSREVWWRISCTRVGDAV